MQYTFLWRSFLGVIAADAGFPIMPILLPNRNSAFTQTQTAAPLHADPLRRALDVGGSLLLLTLSAPVLLLVALAIKLSSPGPVFYRQERVGRGGRLFFLWKLRTMRAEGSGGPLVTAQDDVRITPAGRRLRSWKLDELPQLFNVIKGDMSLVGPRPQVPRFVDRFDPERREIVLSVRPGITGPTALYFRHEEYLLAGQADREEVYLAHILPVKLQMDAEYVRVRSLRGDLRVLADTLYLVLSRLAGRAGRSGIPAVLGLAALQDAGTLKPAQAAALTRTA